MPHRLSPSADTGGAAETREWTLERYELLRQAVVDFGNQKCDPTCDTYGHSETCPNCDTAYWLADQQRELASLRARLAESETLLRRVANESAWSKLGECWQVRAALMADIRAALTPPEPT